MSLADWLANRWLVAHEPTAEEIADLLAVVDRDLSDAAISHLSADWQLSIAYNAALQTATLALVAEGYRPGRERAHERVILSLRETAGIAAATVDLLDSIRRKRNQINYEHAGSTSAAEAGELHEAVRTSRRDVLRWLKRTHPALCPRGLVP